MGGQVTCGVTRRKNVIRKEEYRRSGMIYLRRSHLRLQARTVTRRTRGGGLPGVCGDSYGLVVMFGTHRTMGRLTLPV